MMKYKKVNIPHRQEKVIIITLEVPEMVKIIII